jgi:hypothetical protein
VVVSLTGETFCFSHFDLFLLSAIRWPSYRTMTGSQYLYWRTWFMKILRRTDPLLGNDLVYTFLREPTRATIGRILLGNGLVNTPKTIRDNRRRCFPWVPPRGYITGSSKGAVCLLSRSGSSSGDGSPWWLGRDGKEGIRLWKEDFICDLSDSETVINPLPGYDWWKLRTLVRV